MAGTTLLIEYNDRELQEMLREMSGHVLDMKPIMRNFGQYMILQTEERFEREETPEGTRWLPLSQVTIEMKNRGGDIDKILHAQGNLLHSIVPRALKDGVKISTKREYAAIHQFGGQAGRGRKVKIPQRKFLGFNNADLEEFKQTVKDWIILGRRP